MIDKINMIDMIDISDKIDKCKFFNCNIYEYKEGHKNCIISIEHFIKSCKIPNSFFNEWRDLNSFKIIKDDYSKYFIPIDIDIVVFRGISKISTYNINENIQNLGYVWCTLDKEIAEYYQNYDTSKCYKKNKIDVSLAKKLETPGTMIKIFVPKNTCILDATYFDYISNSVYSQLVLSPNNKYKVILKENNYEEWLIY